MGHHVGSTIGTTDDVGCRLIEAARESDREEWIIPVADTRKLSWGQAGFEMVSIGRCTYPLVGICIAARYA